MSSGVQSFVHLATDQQVGTRELAAMFAEIEAVDHAVEGRFVLHVAHVHVDALEVRLRLLEDDVERPHARHLTHQRFHALVDGA